MQSFHKKVITNMKRSIQNPLNSLNYLMSLVRGYYYILYYKLFTRNIRIGFPFEVHAPVYISGPGAVSIGRNCAVYKNVFKGLTIITHSRKSTVSIGNKCLIGGLTIRCKDRVVIGERTMTAVSLIQDSFFMDQDKMDSLVAKNILTESKSIMIGENVWLGADSIVLGGSRIGKDSVISAGACCFDSEIGEYSLVSGNPAKRPLPIEKLLRFKGAA